MADSHARLTMDGGPPGHTRGEAAARRPHPLVSIPHTDLPLWAKVIKDAGCAGSGLDPEQWFPVSPEASKARRKAAAAITVCSACPVRGHCLELSLRHWDIGQHGVWGGLVAADRAHLRHKRHPSTARQASGGPHSRSRCGSAKVSSQRTYAMGSSQRSHQRGNVNGERPKSHTLLGPYVMDALDSKDRARFERHLARCQECTTEAGSLREATGRLATAACSQPDAVAKEQVLAELARTRQFRRSPTGPGLSRARRRRAR